MTVEIIEGKIAVDDIQIAYWHKKTTAPAEATIVFLHGFPFNKKMWKAQLLALPDTMEGIAVDIRGHGSSSSGHGFFSIDVFAKDIVGLLDALGIQQVVLCGVSMGGYIALQTYAQIPHRIAALLLADTHHLGDSNAGKQKRFDAIQALLKYGNRTFALGFSKTLFTEDFLLQRRDAVAELQQAIKDNSIPNICATQLALASRLEHSSLLPTISCPTLLLCGAQDQITDLTLMQQMHQAISRAELHLIPNCGHLPNIEQPKHFNQLMLQLLNGIDKTH